jgi:hypothetical protein
MMIARLYNQSGGWCKKWGGDDLRVVDLNGNSTSLNPHFMGVKLLDGNKTIATLVLNGHSLVVEHTPEPEPTE